MPIWWLPVSQPGEEEEAGERGGEQLKEEAGGEEAYRLTHSVSSCRRANLTLNHQSLTRMCHTMDRVGLTLPTRTLTTHTERALMILIVIIIILEPLV